MRQRSSVAAMFVMCLSAWLVAPASADQVSDFYKGRAITFMVGYPPGGAYDLYARLIGRHVGRFIPGAPSVNVQNMPGAGSLAAANHVANLAAPDGATIAVAGAALPFAPMLEPATARFDATKVNWLPSPASFTALMVASRSAAVETFSDLQHTEVLMGTLNPGATPSFYAAIINDVLKTRIKLVYGYDSMSQAMLALQRGEVQGYPTAPVDSIKRAYANLVSSGEIKFLLQIGGKPSPDYPNTPFILDQAKTPEERQLIDVALGSLKIGYPYFMAAQAPVERVGAIRKAIMDCFVDPAFLAEASAQTLDINPVPAHEVESIVRNAYAAPKPIIERLRTVYQKQMGQ
jgi:tripartite-type tricarboxylate transporter receptor subunit TctC